MTTAVEQETVVFYASAGQRSKEQGGGQYPSNMIVKLWGGERVMGGNGVPTKAPIEEARFVGGHYQTNDPRAIAELRKVMIRDNAITEDYELYCSRVLTTDQLNRRTNAKNEEVLKENSRLRAKLKEIEGRK